MRCPKCAGFLFRERGPYGGTELSCVNCGNSFSENAGEPLPLYMEKAKTAERHRDLMVHSGKRSKRFPRWQ